MGTPLVSVLLSVYNGAEHLPACLDSVLSQEADLELIAMDDGSSDFSWDILQQYAGRDPRLRPSRNPQNLGLTRSLNRGLDLVRGSYIARQDADDLSLPGRLAAQVAHMERNPSVVLLGGAVELVDHGGQPMGQIDRHPLSNQAIRRKMLLHNAFFHSTVMLRASALSSNNLRYDESLRFAQDYDLWSRLLRLGQGANLPQPLVRFRLHQGQVSRTDSGTQQQVADQVAAANLAAWGLGTAFTLQQVALMRRVAFPPPLISGHQRQEQVACLLRFFNLVDPPDNSPDHQWNEVKAIWMFHLRRHLARWPQDLPELKAQLAILKTGPLVAIRDLSQHLRHRLTRMGRPSPLG